MYRYAVSVNASLIRLPEWRKALSESRFHRIELSCGQYLEPQETKELVELVRNADELAGVETASVHLPFCPFEKFPYPAGEKEREAVAEYLAEFIRLTAPLAAKNYTFHASIEPVRPEERGMLLEQTRPVIASLVRAAAAAGASLNVELLPRTCIGNCVEELLALTDGMPEAAGICFDVNHLTGDGGLKRVPEFIDRLRGRLRSFHLSDYDGVDEAHWLPGLGLLDWPLGHGGDPPGSGQSAADLRNGRPETVFGPPARDYAEAALPQPRKRCVLPRKLRGARQAHRNSRDSVKKRAGPSPRLTPGIRLIHSRAPCRSRVQRCRRRARGRPAPALRAYS